jgi:hypothetical protein
MRAQKSEKSAMSFGGGRVVGAEAAGAGGEAEGDGDVEAVEGLHLAVEPGEPALAVRVGPREAGAELVHAEALEPTDRLVEAWVLEVEPLADAEVGRERREVPERALGRPVLAQEAHVEWR